MIDGCLGRARDLPNRAILIRCVQALAIAFYALASVRYQTDAPIVLGCYFTAGNVQKYPVTIPRGRGMEGPKRWPKSSFMVLVKQVDFYSLFQSKTRILILSILRHVREHTVHK